MSSLNYEDYLRKIWHDPKHPAAFTGSDKLYKIVKQEGKIKIGRHKIKQWLQDQDSYSLSRNIVHKFRRSRYVVDTKDSLWEMDLAQLDGIQSFNSGFKFLLFVIDCFSKYLWIQPIKDKTHTSVLDALKNVLSGTRKPTSIRSDLGKEFKNQTSFPSKMSIRMVLKSTDGSHLFEKNTAHDFTVQLDRQIILEAYWVVALTEIDITYKSSSKFIDDVYVYSNICEESFVGSTEKPLLRKVHISKYATEIVVGYTYGQKLIKADGTTFDDEDTSSIVNLPLQAMWSQMDVYMNNKLVSLNTSNYPWKAYLKTILTSGTDEQKSQLQSQLFMKDSGDLATTNGKNGTNTGLILRRDFIKNSREFEMEGPLFEDIFSLDRHLIQGVDLYIKLYRSTDQFFVISGEDTPAINCSC
ncbi:unnamed protein product [Mytilus coruscus]|uniref:Integrase catalytic domain-containing protein n=1 Tax=Mytilus coruscus TaxID=42192 RepID=A0A6J8D3T3_MYTCO|nr:unnamed protein product [Mytilus coruscus]